MNRFAFVAVFLLGATAQADESAVAVLNIQGTGIETSLLPTLTEVLTVEVDNLGLYKVVSGRDVEAMLGFEKQKDIMGCTDAACLAEIGGALGVERIVAGHIGKVGDTFVVNIKLINIRMADTEARVYETVEGKVDKLIETIRKSVLKLLGPGSKAATTMGVAPKVATATTSPAVSTTKPESTEAAQGEQPVAVETKAGGGGIGWLPITLWSTGGAAVLGGVGLGIAAKNHEDTSTKLRSEVPLVYEVGAQAAGEKAKQAALWSTILWSVGGLATAGGFVAWWLGGDEEPKAVVAPAMLPDGAGVVFSGSF